jgi:group I intron endonuclease
MKIYCIENIIDGKKYVGITKGEIDRRYKQHKEKCKNNTEKQHLHDAMNLYGFDNFIVYQLDEASTKEELFQKEKHWIKKLNSKKEGYNETDGGEGSYGRKVSEDTRLKISKANTGRIQSEEEKKKRSLSNKGIHSKEFNPFYGKKHTKETIDKILSHVSTCIHCGKKAVKCNIKRWHNDNCKMKEGK